MAKSVDVFLSAQSMSIYQTDHITLDVIDRCSPFTLVLVHGHCSNKHAVFFDLIYEESPYNVVRFDSPGQGEAPGVYSLSYLNEVEILSAVFDALTTAIRNWTLDKTVLIGHSRGANVSLLYTQKLFLHDSHQPLPFVVTISGRFNLSSSLSSHLTPEETLRLERGEELEKQFIGCRCPLKLTAEFLTERRSLCIERICQALSEVSKLGVLHGTLDRVVPLKESSFMAQFYPPEKKSYMVKIVDGATHNWKYKLKEGYCALSDLLEELLYPLR